MTDPVANQAADYVERARHLAPLVHAHADRAERTAQLPLEVAEAFHQAGLFRMLLPVELGGGGLTIPASLRVIQEVARLDGSAAWNLAICSGGPLFGHFISHDAFDEIFSDPRAVIAGSLNPTTTRVDSCAGGWRFSGRATYVSGSAQASWLMAAGVVLEDGSPRLVDGVPVLRAGLFPIRHCTILDTWAVSGMRGTGSNDCVFEDVVVPDAFTFRWPEPSSSWKRGPFARIPLTVQLGVGLSTVALGVTRHAIDAFVEIAAAKVPVGSRSTLRDRPLAQMQLAEAEGWLRAACAYLFDSSDEVWRMGEAGAVFDREARAAARLASVTAVKLCARAVDLVHDASGMSAVQTSSPIERCWRDLHTLSQHVILATTRYEVIGRILLGLDPASPII
jgi:alkylation response protein AidB-like acyl-CoA dehydrogenase